MNNIIIPKTFFLGIRVLSLKALDPLSHVIHYTNNPKE